MKRFSLLLSLLLVGCAAPAPTLSTSTGASMQANGLFGPKTPENRPLLSEEKAGDFDRFLEVARKEAVRWQKDAQLTGAQAENVGKAGEKAGGTKYTYTFASGKHGLSIVIAGNNVNFESGKPSAPIQGTFMPAARIIPLALATGKLSTSTYVLALAQKEKTPVYLVAELKSKDAQKVVLNASTGMVLQ